MMVFFAKFLETGWRRFRKYGASGAMVTQSVMDAYESSVGRAIISNSAWMLLMKQTAEAVNRLEKEQTFSGTKTEFQLLKSLKTLSPRPEFTDEAYSEVLVRHSGDSQVCRLYTDRKFQLILTTNKDEKNIRKTYMDTGLDLNSAIDAMIADEKKNARRL
jgi:conjugal transfer ATP-binding protein TraC